MRGFNPRPLCRERLYGNRKGINNMMFQSTPPMQGATVLFCCAGATGRSFNPRPLCRERLRRYAFHPLFKRFNPRPLCRERQLKVVERGNKTWVSIHAPYAGSDLVEPTFDEITDSGFNPRPLCRERLYWALCLDIIPEVSIHAPYAGSDDTGIPQSVLSDWFQSTPPMQGATPGRSHSRQWLGGFNPRPLCRERPN